MMIPNHHQHSSNSNSNSFLSNSSSFINKKDRLYSTDGILSLSSRTIIGNLDQDHDTPCYYREHYELQNQEKVDESYTIMEKGTDSARKTSISKKEDRARNQIEHGSPSSANWMSSKMRMMRKMMTSEQQEKTPNKIMQQKFQDHKQQLSSSLETDHSSSNNSPNYNNIIRVCSDCNTTKTPLWRSGPKGPKSLCNACGIRQRKARRAAAAAAEAEANGVVLQAAATAKSKKDQHNNNNSNKEKGSSSSAESFLKPFKKRFKVKTPPAVSAAAEDQNHKIGLEDLTMSLSNQYSAFQQVFPQDEREGAILLMALSHGLVHG